MPCAQLLRLQIETALADRIPSALTPAPQIIRPTAPTGIAVLDDALGGGLSIGVITELTGPECSGRTSLALSFIAGLTQAARVCAWVDVSDALHPESAAAIGVDLNRLLWIRCGPAPEQLTLPGFGSPSLSPEPDARCTVPDPLQPATCNLSPVLAPRCAEPVPKVRRHSKQAVPPAGPMPNLQPETCNLSPALHPVPCTLYPAQAAKRPLAVREYSRLDQALRVTDLLLQAGGFSAIVLDMGGIAPGFALRVPLATWFRYRASAERTHSSVLLLTQPPCAKSSAGLVLHCRPSQTDPESITVFTGSEHRIEIARDRFSRTSNLIDFARKPPQSDHSILWSSRTPWSATHPLPPTKAGRR